jgi:hypothetical protein
LELFDKWNNATGFFVPGMGYYGEIEAVIIDAVHCGIQMALYNKIKIKEGNVVKGDCKVPKKDKYEYRENKKE